MSKIEDKVAELILERTQIDENGKAILAIIKQRAKDGLEKYGVSMEDAKEPLSKWIENAFEESLDLPIYLYKAILVAKNLEKEVQDLKEQVKELEKYITNG